MCLTVLAYQVSDYFPFILIHNRDEFYNRSFEPLSSWREPAGILGGRDLKSGGIWLGMTKFGHFGTITNFRDIKNYKPDAPSRGSIVKDFLVESLKNQHSSPFSFIQSYQASIRDMNFFNLFFGSIFSPWYFSSKNLDLKKLDPGIYGLSNSSLDTPWPKLTQAKLKTEEILHSYESDSIKKIEGTLFKILEDSTPAEENTLPRTGLSTEKEIALSSIFVSLPQYGTLTSSLILVDSNRNIIFKERVHNRGKKIFPLKAENFQTQLEFVCQMQNSGEGMRITVSS